MHYFIRHTHLSKILALFVLLLAFFFSATLTYAALPAGIDNNLRFWLDATTYDGEPNTLFTDTACTTPVANDGDPVACWKDKSGNNDHVTQVDAAKQPTYVASSPVHNNHRTLQFNKSEADHMLSQVLTTPWSGDYTMFIVFEQTAPGGIYESFFSNGVPNDANHFQININNDSDGDGIRDFGWFANSGANEVTAPFESQVQNELKLYAVRRSTNGATALVETFADGFKKGSVQTNDGAVFEQYRININRISNNYTTSRITEVIIFEGALDETEMAAMNNYLSVKYGKQFGPKPGGVASALALWFKADAGVTVNANSVSAWADQSGNGNNVSQVDAARQPALSGTLNFNPKLDFNADYLTLANLNFVPGTNAREVFSVTRSNTATGTNGWGVSLYLGGENNAANQQNMSFAVFDPADAVINDAVTLMTSGGGVNATEWYANTFASDSSQIPIKTVPALYNYHATANATLSQYVLGYNGEDLTTPLVANNAADLDFTPNLNDTVNGNGIVIGAKQSTTGGTKNAFLKGSIAEIVYYDRELTEQERAQVNSYLALKYGLTLRPGAAGGANDFYWDSNVNQIYDIQSYQFRDNIIGIGKDTGSGLDQRISKSVSQTLSPAIVTLSTDNDFVSDNLQHADSLTDGQYVVLGARGTTADPADLQTTGHNLYTHRVKRDWRIENTGGVSNVHLKFDGFNDEWYVFATAPNTLNDYAGGQLVAQLNANGEVAINPTDGMVFTLAKKKTTLTIDDVTVDETAGTVTLTITADEPVSGGFTVDVATADGTATAGQDYTAFSQALTFAGTANETQTITINITNDTDAEGPETFTVSFSNPSAVTVDASDTATVTINDDDIAVLSVADVSAQESDGQLDFTITVDKAVPGGFTVNVSTVDGTAIAGSDYTALTNQAVTFAGNAGESQTVSVTITNDSQAEQDETFTIQLTTTHPGVDTSATATGTILNDDKKRSGGGSWRNRDDDKDGCTNYQETIDGTDPNDPNDYSDSCGKKKKKPKTEIIYGCLNKAALNYNPKAQLDDGSCKFKDDEKKDDKKTDENKTTEDKKTDEILNKSSCPHFTSYQRLGSRGFEVEKIQAFLKKFGFFNYEITGYYGQITDQAIKAFQARYANEILKPWGITTPTGWWYKTTRAKANELMGCKEDKTVEELVREETNEPDAPQEFTEEQRKPIDNLTLDTKQCPFFTRYFKLGDRDEEIKKIQIFLRKEGVFNYGEATGYYGPITDRAIRAFQSKYADEVLKPWGLSSPTGRWYKTTRAKANELAGCKEGELRLENGVIIR